MHLRQRFPMALLVALLFALGVSHAAQRNPTSPSDVHLAPYLGIAPSLKATVAGRNGLFLFDTGGGVTMLSPAFARQIGCEPWGQITGFRMRGQRLDLPRCDNIQIDLGAVTVEVPTAGVWDIAKMLPADAPPLSGSLALDAFAGRALTLDLSAGLLCAESPSSLKTRIMHATEVPVRLSRDASGLSLTLFVPVETVRGRLWMEIDSGSDAPIVIARHAAALLHLDPDKKAAQPVAMTLVGGVPVHAETVTTELIMDGNIGIPILKTWVLSVDLAAQRLWISPKRSSLSSSDPTGSCTN